MKLKKGDTVIVTLGKDKGKQGKVDRVFAKEETVLVAGINMYKRHMKRREGAQSGTIMDIAKPLNFAKVQIICPKCKKPTRIAYQVSEKDKTRICKKCGSLV